MSKFLQFFIEFPLKIYKTRKQSLFSFLVALILAYLAIRIWLFEILKIIGWAGLSWIGSPHYSIFLINAFTILAFCLPFWINPISKASFRAKLLSFVLLYLCTITAYFISKHYIYIVYSPFAFLIDNAFLLFLVFLIPLLLLTGIPLIINSILNKFLIPIQKKQAILTALSIILCFVCSAASIHFYTGYGTGKGMIDFIKMGYPFFWIVLLMGINGILSNRFMLNIHKKAPSSDVFSDILDA